MGCGPAVKARDRRINLDAVDIAFVFNLCDVNMARRKRRTNLIVDVMVVLLRSLLMLCVCVFWFFSRREHFF